MTGTAARRRRLLFAATMAGCVVLAAFAVVLAARQNHERRAVAARAASAASGQVQQLLASKRPYVLYRAAKAGGPPAGQLRVAPLRGTGLGRSLPLGLDCARVSFAAGRGLCLTAPGPTGFDAVVLDASLRPAGRVHLAGIPSRTRIAPDGRTGTVTAFVKGDTYLAPGAFSTRTTLVDLTSARPITDLEHFDVTRDGQRVTAVDRNFWGVTFGADSDRFFATMATGGVNYLIEGSISARTAHTVRTEVECPSLAPDGRRVVFKHLQEMLPRAGWRLHVYDVDTGRDIQLAETHSIDDQAAWVNDHTIAYGRDGSVWKVPADGTGKPSLWISGAASPTIVRP